MQTRRAMWTAAMVAVLCAPLLASAAPPPASVVRPTYYVQPLGEVADAHARFACRVVRETFDLPCHVLRARPLPRGALDRRRNQYDADALVAQLFDQLPHDGAGLVAITNGDLFERGQTRFVFGLASLVDHVAVVSLARYRGTWWGDTVDAVRFYERYYKVLVHEVGHTLGRAHCENRHCAMRDDRTLADLDVSPQRFCAKCSEALQAAARENPGTAMWHYTRGHGHLNRGRFARAVYHFQRAVELRPGDAKMVNDLGVAYLRRGDTGRALWTFREAARLDAAFANPRYNEGLVFLGAGDPRRAAHAFEDALTAEPTWALAHKQLGELYHQVLGEEGRALAHYQAYLETHGDDRGVADQVRMIKGGGRAAAP